MATRKSNDHFAARAHAMGYPARSVFKLEEILAKNSFIKQGVKVLDLGAAPGSWSLFLARKFEAQLISIDLKKIEVAHPLITALQGDMFSPLMADKLANFAPYKAIISDAAPATTGDRLVDASRSQELAECAFKLAQNYLELGGSFLVKVFQNGGEQQLLNTLKNHFVNVKIMRPQAVRSESFEIYFLALGFKK
jgi:23S rRNA (uridine2552-2'-O)-methyltransferase